MREHPSASSPSSPVPESRLSPERWLGAALVPLAVIGLLVALDKAFLAWSDAPYWIAAASRVTDLSENSDGALRDLVARDEVTWDPTNGARMGEVLAHLRHGEGERVLILGSSQLVTLRDDRRLVSYPRRVDKVLERMAPRPATVYNLAIGGMTARERAIVLDRALEVERFDDVVLCLTPWDLERPTVRSSLDTRGRLEPARKEADPAPGPPRVNAAIERTVRRALAAGTGFFSHRAAIRAWIAQTGGKGQVVAGSQAERAARAVLYRFDEEATGRIEGQGKELVSRLAERSRRHGFRGLVVITPRRPDPEHPLYDPEAERHFRAMLAAECRREGLGFLDASELLDASHYGLYEFGEMRGRIDGLHFDAQGHARLAEALAGALWGSGGAPPRAI